MTDLTTAPEAKSAEAAAAYDELARTFETFKETNDHRVAQLERRFGPDVVTADKLDRVNRAMDEQKSRIDGLVLKGRRPLLGADAEFGDTQTREHKAAFGAYIRNGESEGLKRLESKALSSGSGVDGGFLVPMPAERELLRRMALISPIRSIATVQICSTATFKKAFATNGPAAGWVAETAARPQTGSQLLADLTFTPAELYAMPSATQSLLDDAAIDIEQWINDEIEVVFAEQEGLAFVNGDGVNKPRGFINYPNVANASWTWGNIGYIATGVAGGFAAANPSDQLVDLIYALKAGYRQNGSFVMNRKVQAQVRKFKDTQGIYLWQPPAAVGAPATLMGFPVIEAEDMPDIAASTLSIAFGDFRRGYLVVDRTGIRILRDPFTAKPYVLFYTTKRVGGGVQDFDAIKALKFAVS